jgi:hypothetical protein
MFCPTGNNEESLHRLLAVAVAVSALPLVAFFYSLIVWSAYSFYREIRWTDAGYLKAVVLRWIVVVSSWAVSAGIVALCGTCGEEDTTTTISDGNSNRWCLFGTTFLAAVVYAGTSAKLILSTRREAVVGVETIPFYGSKSLKGKFVVVTGANNGIGFESTRQLAAQGATIAMLCRNPKRAQKAMDDILELQADLHAKDPSKHPAAAIQKDQLLFVPVDLTDFDSIKMATKAIGNLLEERSRTTEQQPSFVDSLVLNAGTSFSVQI